MQNRYPWWKNLLLIALFVIGLVYAVPSFFGQDVAVQIQVKDTAPATAKTTLVQQVTNVLQQNNLQYISTSEAKDGVTVRFANPETQIKARGDLSTTLGDNYTVALSLAPRTPKWLLSLGAEPMKLGLDLRGGVHFLLQVDVKELINLRLKGDVRNVGDSLRNADIRYTGISQAGKNTIMVHFRDADNMNKADDQLSSSLQDYQLTKIDANQKYAIKAILTRSALTKITNYAIDQTMSILNNRVNALGVSEAVVQRQGLDKISVDLPGVQDIARAKSIIGKVATLKFQLVDTKHDVQSAVAGDIPVGSQLYMFEGRPMLLYDHVILRGDSITYATSSFGQDGRPSVNIRLGGGGENLFNRITSENIGKPLAVVYVETQSKQQKVDGKMVTIHKQKERIINVATIQSALGGNFQITGLESPKYAQDLSLLLRSGALIAPIDIVQESTVGPSLGLANIHMGVISIVVGFLAVVLFMLFYYRFFGFVADVALFLNLIFIMAIFSILGVTLSLAGMAAMVLTVGMAVDANVLIYERIREELRNGVSPQASIHIGYELAFITIVDSNVTTLIVAVVLFALGSGQVKGFAVTLIVGLLCSMLTSIMFTRAIVNWVYGGRTVKKLSIGIK